MTLGRRKRRRQSVHSRIANSRQRVHAARGGSRQSQSTLPSVTRRRGPLFLRCSDPPRHSSPSSCGTAFLGIGNGSWGLLHRASFRGRPSSCCPGTRADALLGDLRRLSVLAHNASGSAGEPAVCSAACWLVTQTSTTPWKRREQTALQNGSRLPTATGGRPFPHTTQRPFLRTLGSSPPRS